ncbi:uncharacterized protein N0V89_001682 [Didymosphaeria variabile]|uniref:NAD(P)-binding protein n=1 Tax=Didymosphaeria variabile TaxID=1932322 RepID=A0A9W9CG49_9PLEO|nr:uncharacterized protein N0V89_001682 [Didymosphaeria variabile]KAJ4361113.1 hypothetical protein N0V89_001682 [Didymosphaeria variabile]
MMLSTSGIRVNGIAPGFTQSSILTSSSIAEKGSEYKVQATEKDIQSTHSKFFERAGLLDSEAQSYYYNRMADPEEIASIGVFLASELSKAVNGQVILADSGKTAAATGEACTGKVPRLIPLEV